MLAMQIDGGWGPPRVSCNDWLLMPQSLSPYVWASLPSFQTNIFVPPPPPRKAKEGRWARVPHLIKMRLRPGHPWRRRRQRAGLWRSHSKTGRPGSPTGLRLLLTAPQAPMGHQVGGLAPVSRENASPGVFACFARPPARPGGGKGGTKRQASLEASRLFFPNSGALTGPAPRLASPRRAHARTPGPAPFPLRPGQARPPSPALTRCLFGCSLRKRQACAALLLQSN